MKRPLIRSYDLFSGVTIVRGGWAFIGPLVLLWFEFCTLQFCKCDISKSIIGRGLKLLSACRVQWKNSLVKIKKKNHDFFLNNCCLNIVLFSLIFCNCYNSVKPSGFLTMRSWVLIPARSIFFFLLFFSSPEPKAHWWAFSIQRYPSSVVNIFKRLLLWGRYAEAAMPILLIFHI